MPSSPSPTEVLRRNHEAAQRLVAGVSKARTLELLKTAQLGLERRLRTAEGLGGPGRGSFTAVKLRSTLAQVKAVLAPLQIGMRGVVLEQGKQAAAQAATGAARYLHSAEQRFKGLGSQRLALDQAKLVDRAVAGTESSVLSRLLGGQHEGKRAGILQRYGHNVVGHFEDILQQRVIQKTPWEEVKSQLIEKSPFLQGAPAHWAERIVRTEVANQAGRASQESIVEADKSLGDMCKILSAVFDARTGSDSYSVHGQIRRPSESFDSWFGSFMHPPDRPNDRGIVVPHRISWPIPAELKPKGAGAVSSRWAAEGRKGGPPSMPLQTTIPLDQFGKEQAAPARPKNPGSQVPAEVPRQESAQLEPKRVQAQVPDVLQRAPERVPPRVIEAEPEQPRAQQSATIADFKAAGIETWARSESSMADVHSQFQSAMGVAMTPLLIQDLVGAASNSALAKEGEYEVLASGRSVSVKFESPNARITRDYHRDQNGDLVAHHEYFKLDGQARKGGAGKQVIRSQVEQYDKIGVKKIETEAAWDGQYVWPRMGFTMRDPEQFLRVKSEFARYLKHTYSIPLEVAEQMANVNTIHELAMSSVPTDLESQPLEDVKGLKREDLHKAGKRFLLDRGNVSKGDHLRLEVKLGSGAPEEKVFRSYLAEPAR